MRFTGHVFACKRKYHAPIRSGVSFPFWSFDTSPGSFEMEIFRDRTTPFPRRPREMRRKSLTVYFFYHIHRNYILEKILN